MNKFLPCLLLTLLFGCNEQDKNALSVYFAGEIVNPRNDSVILYKDEQKICSAKLDSDNRFVIELDASAEDGLYHFEHQPERQYIYLEKGDSLMIRLNTADFDESLVFTGKGEAINNFLIETFLQHEKEDYKVYRMYSKNPQDFSQEIALLKDSKLNTLATIKLDAQLSDKAYEIAKAWIDYTSFLYKERYPVENRRAKNGKKYTEVSNDFVDYYNEIDYNNPDLTYVRPYYDFMKYHFTNLAYQSCVTECGEKGRAYRNAIHFNRHKLKVIDSLAKEENLKNNLVKNVASEYLLRTTDSKQNVAVIIDEFNKYSTNKNHRKEIESLYQNINNIQPNNAIPNILIKNSQQENVSLQTICKDNKVVFYFWMGDEKSHFKQITKRVKKLKYKNPDYTFVGINLMTEANKWERLINNYHLNKDYQFRAENLEEINNALLINGRLNKAVIVNNGLIVDAFADIYSSF